MNYDKILKNRKVEILNELIIKIIRETIVRL